MRRIVVGALSVAKNCGQRMATYRAAAVAAASSRHGPQAWWLRWPRWLPAMHPHLPCFRLVHGRKKGSAKGEKREVLQMYGRRLETGAQKRDGIRYNNRKRVTKCRALSSVGRLVDRSVGRTLQHGKHRRGMRRPSGKP